MPTLGFFKKKRAKESSTKDGAPLTPTTTNASSTLGSPITPTATNPTNATDTTADAHEAPVQPLDTSNHANSSTAAEPSMMKEPSYQQPYTAPPQQVSEEQKHQLPHIHNLIHPSQNDAAGQSHPAQMADQPFQGVPTNSGTPTQQQQQPTQVRTTKGKYNLLDFDIRRTLGTGSFGRVHLVQSKHNQRFYAIKVLKKAQVVKMKQIEHTNDERRMLQEVKHPFLVTLWGTFQDSKNLYMVMDFVEGGELFSLLRKSQVYELHLPS